MSVLDHLCLECTHRISIHDARSRGYTDCACCNTSAGRPDATPTLIETFALPGHRLEPLYPPGSARNSGTMHTTTACDCERCHETYARLTGGTANSSPREHPDFARQ